MRYKDVLNISKWEKWIWHKILKVGKARSTQTWNIQKKYTIYMNRIEKEVLEKTCSLAF